MDRINANVFREMKNAKHGKKVNDIYAPKKRSPDKRKFLQPTGKYELFDDVPGYNQNQFSGKSNQMISNKNQINQINEINDEPDLYYADPNNYTRDLKTNMVVSKNGVITRTNGTGITTLQAMVNNPNNKNAPEAWQYKIRTQKMEDPDLDMDSQQLQEKKSKMTAQEKQIAKMTGRVLVNNVKNNRMTKGTQGMMDNERLHAQEAIESGIYVNWSTISKGGKSIDCFRIGSNSMCICGHGFPCHDKILTKKKNLVQNAINVNVKPLNIFLFILKKLENIGYHFKRILAIKLIKLNVNVNIIGVNMMEVDIIIVKNADAENLIVLFVVLFVTNFGKIMK